MKKLILILAIITSTLSSFTQDFLIINKKGGGNATYSISNVDSISFTRRKTVVPDYVIINGIKWATKNVDAPGTFASSPEASGSLFQWNSSAAKAAASGYQYWWNTTWNGGFASPSSSDTWEKVNDPSPAGYHVPTSAQIQSLLNTTYVTNTWTTQNGVNGRKFTDIANGNSIFLPASGYRSGYLDGEFLSAGSNGVYWCNDGNGSKNASNLDFNSSNAYWYFRLRANGQSVRPVAE